MTDQELWEPIRQALRGNPDFAKTAFMSFVDALASVRAEATRTEREANAARLDEEAKRHEDAMDSLPADNNHEEYTMHCCAATDFRSIAAAIRARTATQAEGK